MFLKIAAFKDGDSNYKKFDVIFFMSGLIYRQLKRRKIYTSKIKF